MNLLQDNQKAKVSLILTTYNCKENFQTTMESILTQDYPNIEIVVKDGGSTDGTLDVIKSFADRIGSKPSGFSFCWESEPDTGIYDAMNQGYHLSTGDIVAFFNDRFTRPDAVSMLVDSFADDDSLWGTHADLNYADGDKVIRKWHMGRGKVRHGWMPGHPTLYLRRSVYERFGLYDTSYRCSADFEFMVRILTDHEEKLAYLPQTVISMYYGGTSTGGLTNYWLSIDESHKALLQNGVRPAWGIIFLRVLRTMKQFV